MMQQVLSHYSMPALACVGLGLFLLVFTGAVGWVCRKGGGHFYNMLGALPFDDDKEFENERR